MLVPTCATNATSPLVAVKLLVLTPVTASLKVTVKLTYCGACNVPGMLSIIVVTVGAVASMVTVRAGVVAVPLLPAVSV